MAHSIANLRTDYTRSGLSEREADPDPFKQFERWFTQALEAEVTEPTAMTLATVAPDGAPSARIVLLKGFDERGFVFFTNYDSRKGSEIGDNNRVAVVFWWAELQRQVRIEGTAEKIPAQESDEYFASRPRGSRIGAWASRQSAPLGSRAELEEKSTELEQAYENREIPRPPYWGGYRIAPDRFEFWQGRPSRLHDRLRYRNAGDAWIMDRLAP